MLEGGKRELLARIARMQPDKLLQLLEVSHFFVHYICHSVQRPSL